MELLMKMASIDIPNPVRTTTVVGLGFVPNGSPPVG
jgi:hypothetical protein